MQQRAHAGRRAARALALALAAAALWAPWSPAAAQGFGLNEIGSCAIGRGFAVTGAPCDDASVLYWNPAAATTLARGLSAYGGVSAVQVRGSFTADATRRRDAGDVPVEFPPFLGVNWRNGRLALGVAGYVPYGLTSQWRDDFPGRFAAQRASLQTIYVQPNVAFELVPGRLSVGGGPVFGHSSLELRQALDFSASPITSAPLLAAFGLPAGSTYAALGYAEGTEFARAQIEGSGTGFGYNLGAFARVSDALSVGVRYLSEVRFDYEEGEATFTPSPAAAGYVLQAGNPLLGATTPALPAGTTLATITGPQFTGAGALAPGQLVSSRIDHPAQFQVGVGFTGIRNATLSADYALIRWSSFQELPVTFLPRAGGGASPPSRTIIENYEDSHSVRVGGEYRLAGGLAGRAGFSYATSPAPDETVTPLLPDMDRYNVNVGVGIPLGARLALDAAYLRVETEGRRGRTGERTAAQTAEQVNNGFYALNANIFSLSLKARF
ncbi:outer membrane protein transport protein [Roseisolibacter sp. H3M3-2]|uniref:OmpP1/FadL family transporter n=1 Tax=Roseisolibacter sp. H3M3-2 TaxID=3031323 RepID=UPI0023DA5C8F|nr:outer membrane protein transport protein [Roseisolibacter sp. H3M3-2]MDF1504203.1 outer membrane protein transport protein [Roseisolibacter sp. H3M3-2]